MDDPYAVDRRGFLRAGATAAAATAVACGAQKTRWRALRDDEAVTLAAACDRILPRDQDPGASDAGVVRFIDRQLATREREALGSWQAGLRALDATAARRHGRAFVSLAAGEQDAVLRAIESGAVEPQDWPDGDPRDFFDRLRRYTMMGFYGDPRHGGNQDRVAWTMLGIPDPPVRGRLHETAPPQALAPRGAQAHALHREQGLRTPAAERSQRRKA